MGVHPMVSKVLAQRVGISSPDLGIAERTEHEVGFQAGEAKGIGGSGHFSWLWHGPALRNCSGRLHPLGRFLIYKGQLAHFVLVGKVHPQLPAEIHFIATIDLMIAYWALQISQFITY
jgi:hypothetical protein